MTPADFSKAGRAIFGGEWQGPLSAVTGIGRRSIARMVSGALAVPPRLADSMARAIETLALISELSDEHGPAEEINITAASDPAVQWTRGIVVAALKRDSYGDVDGSR